MPSITRLKNLSCPEPLETSQITSNGASLRRLAVVVTSMKLRIWRAPVISNVPPINSWKRLPYLRAI